MKKNSDYKGLFHRTQAAALLAIALLIAAPAFADDAAAPVLTIKNRAFAPAEITIPAGQKVKITVKNEDSEAAEFESLELNREKVVPANDQITLYIGPLDPGSYPFFNDFDPQKAKGKIVAK